MCIYPMLINWKYFFERVKKNVLSSVDFLESLPGKGLFNLIIN